MIDFRNICIKKLNTVEEKNNYCNICMESNLNLIKLQCGHSCCKKCMDRIIESNFRYYNILMFREMQPMKITCPYCRKNIFVTNDNEINIKLYYAHIYEIFIKLKKKRLPRQVYKRDFIRVRNKNKKKCIKNYKLWKNRIKC